MDLRPRLERDGRRKERHTSRQRLGPCARGNARHDGTGFQHDAGPQVEPRHGAAGRRLVVRGPQGPRCSGESMKFIAPRESSNGTSTLIPVKLAKVSIAITLTVSDSGVSHADSFACTAMDVPYAPLGERRFHRAATLPPNEVAEPIPTGVAAELAMIPPEASTSSPSVEAEARAELDRGHEERPGGDSGSSTPTWKSPAGSDSATGA